MNELDHIVYRVANLEEAMERFNTHLGVRPVYGGQHLERGTHNAILNLGNESYLELIAIDPLSKVEKHTSWMGMGQYGEEKIIRWAVKSDNLSHDIEFIKNQNASLGRIINGERKIGKEKYLKWKMSLPSNIKDVDIIPFLIDWSQSDAHPTDKLDKSVYCKCLEMTIDGKKIDYKSLLRTIMKKELLNYGSNVAISAILKSPKGLLKI